MYGLAGADLELAVVVLDHQQPGEDECVLVELRPLSRLLPALGLRIRAMLIPVSPVFAPPKYSSIVLGSVPAEATTVGIAIFSGIYIRSGCGDADEVEAAGDDVAGGGDQCEPERLLLAALRLEHDVLVVEAVEVVGEPDRVHRDRMRARRSVASRTTAGNSSRRFTSSRSSAASGIRGDGSSSAPRVPRGRCR